jgi:hypothetical protein
MSSIFYTKNDSNSWDPLVLNTFFVDFFKKIKNPEQNFWKSVVFETITHREREILAKFDRDLKPWVRRWVVPSSRMRVSDVLWKCNAEEEKLRHVWQQCFSQTWFYKTILYNCLGNIVVLAAPKIPWSWVLFRYNV